MDCLYQAYSDHLADLGLKANWLDAALYRLLKWQTHGLKPQPTFGGVVPYITQALACLHDLSVTIQYRLWTPAHYEAVAENEAQKQMVRFLHLGREVRAIALSPAICLDLSTKHAFYSPKNDYRPFSNIIMAIQLQRRY